MRLGRKVAVIGGGNAAIDSARTALRMGAEVTVIYRRERKDMPAIRGGDRGGGGGGRASSSSWPRRTASWATTNGDVKAIEVVKTRLGEFDASGRRRPVPPTRDPRLECDTVILAVGEAVDLDFCAPPACAQGERHARSRPLHAGDQPQQVLRRRRPDHRRVQRLQRHGLRQEGGAQDRRAADGRVALGQIVPAVRVRPRCRRRRRATSRRHRGRRAAGAGARGSLRGGRCIGLTAEEAAGRSLPLPALRHPRTRSATAVRRSRHACRKFRFESTANCAPPTKARPSSKWRAANGKYIPTLC